MLRSFWEADHSVLKESHCLFRSGLKAHYSDFGHLLQPCFGCPLQQKGSKQIQNKQFQSQTAQPKPSVKHSLCISPLKVEVERCVVLLKRGFLQQTSSKPTTSCCYNKKCFKEWIIFSSVNIIFMKPICFMVCTCVQKNTSVYAFCHNTLLK